MIEINELLRFSTAGSVDDGKSTLIGRLLYDSKSIFEDQLAAITKSTERRGREGIDLALLTDGLSAEREQGITIDVAYRYFSTPKRKFIIADTPGHEQYTRNMVTGASTADLALILIDARKGILPQSRRHTYISQLLGIKHIVVCVNKMDLVDYSEEVFNRIEKDFREFAKPFAIHDLRFVPLAAKWGDNVVNKSEKMPWYKRSALLEILEGIEVVEHESKRDLRFPVQYVSRPNAQFRGYAGTVAAGIVSVGQEIVVLPLNKKTKIKSIVTGDGEIKQALHKQAVSLTLEDELDVSRGDMIVAPENPPRVQKETVADVCWMSEEELSLKRKYILKQGSLLTKAVIEKIEYRVDMATLTNHDADQLGLNDIARIKFKTLKPLVVDAYLHSRATGSFILIDEATHNTVAAGMVV